MQQPSDDELREITSQVIAIWESVLGMQGIHSDSHLLDLGATSLTAVRIRSRVRAELGREIDLIDFLEYPTPRELAPIVAVAPRWEGPALWRGLQWEGEPGRDGGTPA
jgi:acyl carrier protein